MPEGGAGASTVTMIAPKQLVVSEDRATASYEDGQRELLRADIQKRGIQVPLDVVDVDGDLVIADGFNRCMIALELGIEEVPCIVRKGTMKDALLENLVANQRRGRNKPGEMARVVLALREQHGATVDEISERTSLSTGWIRKLLSLSVLHAHVLASLDAGAVSLGVAMELARLPEADAQLRSLQLAQNYGWTVAEAERMVDGILRELQKPPAERVAIEDVKPSGVRCALCGGEFQPHEMVSAIVCHGDWGLAVSAVRDVRAAVTEGVQAP